MIFVIETQYWENYGNADEPYWKPKGGSSYKVHNVPAGIDLEELISVVSTEVEKDNDYAREYIIATHMESDDWLSWFEQSQLEYEGTISLHEPEIDYNILNERYA